MTGPLEATRAVLESAARVVVVTGAGMSSESGVPTFRDALTGLWARYDPQELATAEAFQRHPARVFGWYVSRRRRVLEVEPHAGHRAIVDLSGLLPALTIVTQNVDSLHQRAGSLEVIELHGSLEAFRCVDGGHPFDVSELDELSPGADAEMPPPACATCGSSIRPGVVWFGEALPPDAVRQAWHEVEQCDAMLVVGTSGVVYPAAELPRMAKARGASVVEINPSRTPLSDLVDVHWPATAGDALPALVDYLQGVERTQ